MDKMSWSSVFMKKMTIILRGFRTDDTVWMFTKWLKMRVPYLSGRSIVLIFWNFGQCSSVDSGRHIASHYAWQEIYSKNELWYCMVAFFPYISSSNYKRKHNGWNKIPLHRRAHNKRLHAFRPGVIIFLYRSLTHVSAGKIKALRLFQWRVGITSITLEKSIRVAILSFCNLVKHLH